MILCCNLHGLKAPKQRVLQYYCTTHLQYTKVKLKTAGNNNAHLRKSILLHLLTICVGGHHNMPHPMQVDLFTLKVMS